MAAVAKDGNRTPGIEGRLTGFESRLARLEALMDDVATRPDEDKSSKSSTLRGVMCTLIAALWLIGAVIGSLYYGN